VANRNGLNFANRRAVTHVVESNPGLAKELRKGGPGGRQARKYKSTIAIDTGGRLHRTIRAVRREARTVIALNERNGLYPSVEVKGPGMVRADEGRSGVAGAATAQLDPSVRASVIKNVNTPVGPTDHDQRLTADTHGVEVTNIRYLRLVSAVDPDLLPDVGHLPVKDLTIRVHVSVYAVRFDIRVNRLHVERAPVGDAAQLTHAGSYHPCHAVASSIPFVHRI
jgi:hypothetical protein